MKIYNLKEFLKLPENTLYCEYNDDINSYVALDHFQLKGETLLTDKKEPWDFMTTRHLSKSFDATDYVEEEKIWLSLEENKEVPLSLEFNRDASYDPDQLYLVYDKKDVTTLISALQKCL